MNSSVSQPLRLEIRNLGHIPALKNSFHAIVNPAHREWKRKCVESFVSQLLSGTATTGSGIPMLLLPPYLTALLPPDDRWQIIAETHVYCVKVKPGEQGADLLIEKIYE